MASFELSKAAQTADQGIQQIQSVLDMLSRSIVFVQENELMTEYTGMQAGEEIAYGVSKERCGLDFILAANLLFYLRGINDGNGNTVFGGTPLTALQLKENFDKLGI